jgi:glycine betaine catabolism B
VPDVLTLPVRSVVATTPLTRLIRLDLGTRPFVFQAGQAALIGTHGQTERRPYSIASSPDDAVRHHRLEFLVKVDAHGSIGPHLAAVTRGTRIDFEGPTGAFTLVPAPPAAAYLFVAGGTGISPLRAMVRHLIASGAGAAISVLYSARVPGELAFREELERLARRRLLRLHLTITGDTDAWDGIRGRISLEALARALPSKDAVCYLCGPPAMVEDVPPFLRQLGVPSSHVRTEEW